MATLATPEQTATATPYAALVDALRVAVLEVAQARIVSPPRQVIGMPGGATLLSMVATAPDISVHKLVTVVPGNAARGLPTIQGQVQVLDTPTGSIRLTLDGATLTGRRTAAMSMLGIFTLRGAPPACVLVIGTGTQARHHADALRSLYPAVQLDILGRSLAAAQRFCDELALRGVPARAVAQAGDSAADVVITCTTSSEPVVGLAASAHRLLIAVGSFTPAAAEIAGDTVRASQLYVDDPAGARHEAGDLIRAGIDWRQVHALSDAVSRGAPTHTPILFKTVGCAAWDLAAARVALAQTS